MNHQDEPETADLVGHSITMIQYVLFSPLKGNKR